MRTTNHARRNVEPSPGRRLHREHARIRRLHLQSSRLPQRSRVSPENLRNSRQELTQDRTNFDPSPKVGKKQVDLLKLYDRVTSEGGYDAVSDTKSNKLAWRKIGQDFRLGNSSDPTLAFTLKTAYYKNLVYVCTSASIRRSTTNMLSTALMRLGPFTTRNRLPPQSSKKSRQRAATSSTVPSTTSSSPPPEKKSASPTAATHKTAQRTIPSTRKKTALQVAPLEASVRPLLRARCSPARSTRAALASASPTGLQCRRTRPWRPLRPPTYLNPWLRTNLGQRQRSQCGPS